MPKLSIIIVNYNAGAFLRRCLDSIYGQPCAFDLETIVVDNNSHDGSCALIRAMYPQVCLVEQRENLGFAGGNNVGIRKSTGDYLLLLNCDTRVLEGALETLVGFLDGHEDTGVVTARVVYPDMSDQGVGRAFPTPMNVFFGRRSLLTRLFPNNKYAKRYLVSRERSGEEPFEVDWVSGACLMVRRDVLEKAGLLDEQFFMYWEDADLCYRIKQLGWKVFCVPTARVIHYEGKCSTGGRSGRLIWEFNRSAYRYYRKHHIRSRFGLMNVLAVSGIVARTGVLLVANACSSLAGRVK